MALSLLQRVATKALDTLGGAATSAINYLSKNAPHVIDKTLEVNPNTRVFSTRGQSEVANFGRTLQKTPDTTIKAPKPFIQTPITQVQDKAGEFLTSIPGEFARSWGRTAERVATPKGRQRLVQGAMQLPSQVKKGDIGGIIENPVIEDTLNATDLLTLGLGTALKAGGKQVVKEGTKQLFKTGTKEVVKELAEKEGKVAAKTLFKEAGEKGVGKKTVELFTKVGKTVEDPQNRELAMNYLKKTRKGIEGAVNTVKTDAELAMDALKRSRQGTGQVTGDVAQAAGEVIEPIKKKTADIFQKGTDIARKWINTREGFTNWRAGDIKRNPLLTQFDKEGLPAIIDLQSGKNAARYQPVKEFTDGLFELEKQAGVLDPNQYRKNYLPQLWDNTPEEIEQVFKSKKVGGQAGFSKSRMFEDYSEGIKAGLTPRFNTMSDLLESRFKTAQRALADKQLVENLMKTGNAKTLDKAPPGWQAIDLKFEGQALAVDPQTAKMIQNYVSEGSPLLEKVGQFVSNAKQTILSAGIPKTGWNFHTGVNVPIRAMAARKNPFGAIVDSVIWNTNPRSAVDYIEKTVPKDITDGLLRNGLTISRSTEAGGYGFKPKAGKSTISKVRTGFDKLFSEAAFDKVLPAHKLKVGWETYQQALKNGATQDEAYRIGAETANTVFGGIDPATMSRSKDFQNIMRTFLLAPDWLESNVRIAGKVGGLMNPKNWSKPEYAPFKRFAVNAASMYGAFAMTNKAISGHWPWENGTGQEFNLATGTYDERGRERMVPAFGTAFDFARIPLQLVQAANGGDMTDVFRPLKNRLSPPIGAAVNTFITGEDYRGRPIDTPMEYVGQGAQAIGIPSQITNVIGGLTGEQTPEEVAAGLLEAPVRYRGGANTAEKRKTADLLKEGGASNKDINQAFDTGGQQKEGILSSLFGEKDYSTLGTDSEGKITMPKNKKERDAFNKSVDTALENGAVDLPDNAIITRFFDGKTYDKSARKGQQEILDAMLDVENDEFLSPEQKAKIAEAAKIDPADLQYYKTASLDQDSRLEELLQYANTTDPENHEEFLQNLMLGKKEVGGKSMFSTSMFDLLYDQGFISKEEKALITAVKYDPIYNKFYMDRDYKGGGGGGMTASKVKSYINSVNSLFKKSIKSTSNVDKQLKELSQAEEAPKISFSKPQRAKGTSTGRWFRQY